jgi:hypothetical protein
MGWVPSGFAISDREKRDGDQQPRLEQQLDREFNPLPAFVVGAIVGAVVVGFVLFVTRAFQ